MPEYYIKLSADGDAEGPYPIDTLRLLVEAQKITPTTPHFYDDIIGWQPIEANPALRDTLFPSTTTKPKLTLKKSSPPSPTPTTSSSISVEQMLATAQGKGPIHQKVTDEQHWQSRTAALALPILGILHLIMGLLLIGAHWDALVQLSQDLSVQTIGQSIIFTPALALGAVTFLVGVGMALSVAAFYPAARYTALMLMGYLGIQAWSFLYEGYSQPGWILLAAGVAWGISVLTITLTLRFVIFCSATAIAMGAIAAYAWQAFLG